MSLGSVEELRARIDDLAQELTTLTNQITSKTKMREKLELDLIIKIDNPQTRLTVQQISALSGRTIGTIRNILSQELSALVDRKGGVSTLTLAQVREHVLSRATGPRLSEKKVTAIRMMHQTAKMKPADIAETMNLSHLAVQRVLLEAKLEVDL